jgi:hypothetical protein
MSDAAGKSVQLVVEGELDEYVLRRLVNSIGGLNITACLGKRGKKNIEQHIQKYNNAAPYLPSICLIDLDNEPCVVTYLHKLIPAPHANLVIRIAVCEIESWLIADRDNLSAFLGVAANKLPAYPDHSKDPKAEIVSAARSSRRKEILQDLIPAPNSTSKVGKAYVAQLIKFVLTIWDIETARQHSPSLQRAFKAITRFATQ